jgi:hypothetical protein
MLRKIIFLLLLPTLAYAAPKPHAVVLGKWTTVKWLIGPEESQPTDLKVRQLIVDGHMKDYVTGPQHDITEHLFVIRRVFRVNDSLPDEKAPAPQWLWQRSGWLLVDRSNGHTTNIVLPEYDFYYSAIAWYRDYAAYCGMAEDGKRVVAIVAQIGRRQPVLKKTLGEPAAEDAPDSACGAPLWQRRPARVTFEPMNAARFTYAIRGHAATAVAEEDSDETAAK